MQRPTSRSSIPCLIGAFALTFAGHAVAKSEPLYAQDFADATDLDGNLALIDDGGVDGTFARFTDGGGRIAEVPIAAPFARTLTLAAHTRAPDWPGEGKGFSKTTPPTLLAVARDPGNAVAILRVRLGQPELAFVIDGKKKFAAISAPDPLPVGTWAHVAGTYDGKHARLYIDGVEVAEKRLSAKADIGGEILRLGATGTRRLAGDLDNVAVYGEALSADAIAELAAASADTESDESIESGDTGDTPSDAEPG